MLATWGCTTFPKPTLSLDFLGATSLDSGITFSRGSQATLFDSTGTLRYARNNTLTFSQDFGNAIWSKQASVSVSTNTTIAPDGTLTADTVTADSGLAIFQNVTVSNGQRVTQSVYLRAGTATSIMFRDDTGAGRHIVVNPSTGVITSTSGTLIDFGSISMGNGWYRIYMSYTADSTLVRALIRPDSAGSGQTFIVWGAQTNFYPMEGGVTSSLTTYYPTTTAAYYAPRFDYNPSTLQPRGLLIEEQRTNSIRNNTMQGAVAGTPGTLPTNWFASNTGTGLTFSVVGTGTENGITYIDLRYQGTATSGGTIQIFSETATAVVATSGQTWTSSGYWKIAAGSATGLSGWAINTQELNAAGGFLAQTVTAVTAPTTAALNTQRPTATVTLGNASTARTYFSFLANYSNGAAIDITLRIGLPQLEQGAFATSVIPTTTTALTRNADVASMTGTNFSSWYSASEGTLFAQSQRIGSTTAAGFPRVASANDNTANNEICVLWAQATSKLFGVCVTSGATQCDLGYTGQTQTNNYKTAFAYKANDFAFTANAQAVQTDTNGTLPTVDRFTIGNIAGSSFLNGHIARLSFYPQRLPDATLVALTA